MAYAGRKKVEAQREPIAPSADWVVVGLSVLGLVIAGYLTWLKWAARGALLCTAGSGCDLVQASRYSMFLFVPTALWGALLYIAVGVLAGLGLTQQRWLAAFVLVSSGVGFSTYLTWLSISEVGGTCVYCLASSVILLALLVTLLWRRPAMRGRKSPLRPAPLTGYGILAAVATIILGAFVFASPWSAPVGYQSALARHLKQSGAVMYGAFW
jgi:uncharacterized membrane protein